MTSPQRTTTSSSLTLARITMREIHLELVEPFRTSAGEVRARRVILLELEDGDGTTAWSECVAESSPSYSPDTVDTSWLAIAKWIVPVVIGHRFTGPSDIHPALERRIRGHHMGRAAVEMGAWTLDAMRRSQSLASLLTAASESARTSATTARLSVETGIALGMQDDPTALADRARAARTEGYRKIKLKIAPGHDIAHVDAVRRATGPDTAIAVDANCSYSLDVPDHLRALLALDTRGLSMIEQPLAHDDIVRHAELQRRLTTPICLDESVSSEASVEAMLALGSGRIVNLKAGRVGGFTPAIAIHDRCAMAGVATMCGGMLESGIGRACNVALASLPNFTVPGDLSPSARYWTRDIVTPAWTMDSAGRVRVPHERAGLGVDVDVGFIDGITVRHMVFRAP